MTTNGDMSTAGEGAGLALITGAGGGLAPAVALRFAAAGYRLALITRPGKESEIDDLVGRLHAGAAGRPSAPTKPAVAVHVYGVDLASASQTQATFARIEADLGQVDALLNLAGGFATGKAGPAGLDLVQHMLEANFRTAVNATAALLPGMTGRGSGFVAGMGANAVLSPAPGATAYAAAKGALAAYCRSLAAEVGKEGVNVALLIPSATIDTPGSRAAMPNADTSKWVDPAALADALLFLAGRQARGRVHEMVVAPA